MEHTVTDLCFGVSNTELCLIIRRPSYFNVSFKSDLHSFHLFQDVCAVMMTAGIRIQWTGKLSVTVECTLKSIAVHTHLHTHVAVHCNCQKPLNWDTVKVSSSLHRACQVADECFFKNVTWFLSIVAFQYNCLVRLDLPFQTETQLTWVLKIN